MKITIEVDGSSATLSELVRAFQKQALPSATLIAVIRGVEQAERETTSSKDRGFLRAFSGALGALLDLTRKLEDDTYGWSGQ